MDWADDGEAAGPPGFTYVGAGAATIAASSASTHNVATHADTVAGDFVILVAYLRNFDSEVSGATMLGNAMSLDFSNIPAFLSRLAPAGWNGASDSIVVSVDFPGSNITTILRAFTFRPVGTPAYSGLGSNLSTGTAQNIAGPSPLGSYLANDLLLIAGGKADDWTGAGLYSGAGFTWIEASDDASTLGSDAGLVVDYAIAAAGGSDPAAGSFTITGGASAAYRAVMARYRCT